MKISVNYPKRFKKLPQQGSCYGRINTSLFIFLIRNFLRRLYLRGRVFMHQTVIRIIGLWKKNKLLLIDGSSVAFRAALYNQIDRLKMPMVCIPMRLYGFNLMLYHLSKVQLYVRRFWCRKDVSSDGDVCRPQRGRKTPDEFREQFPSYPWTTGSFGIRHYELAQYEADDILERLIRWQKLPSNFLKSRIGPGTRIWSSWQMTIRWLYLPKGVAEFENSLRPISKKRWADTRAIYRPKALDGR